jgi:hypothetical protein|tara:strand:- start:807 stop:1007 length:201 start_codon:yes stop_codon:yes gene_type:complete
MSLKKDIGVTSEISPHSDRANNIALALSEAFDAGQDKFEQQLVQLSDQQYVSLLTLLDECSATFRA